MNAARNTTPAPVTPILSAEPIIDLIARYDAGVASFEAEAAAFAATGLDPARTFDEDAAADRHYGHIFNEICKNPPPIKTAAGALAALRFFHVEHMGFAFPDTTAPLMTVVMAFLEGQVQS